jgi:hypothetical protein
MARRQDAATSTTLPALCRPRELREFGVTDDGFMGRLKADITHVIPAGLIHWSMNLGNEQPMTAGFRG